MPKDELFAGDSPADDFTFDHDVAEVLDDMLARSVPQYAEIQRMTGEIAAYFAQPETNIYDLGCATGSTLLHLSKTQLPPAVTLIGVDNSEAVLDRAREKLASHGVLDRCRFVAADLNTFTEIDNASVVILNLTLQFVRPLYRDALIRTIRRGLADRGCLILIEKVLGNESMINRLFIDFHYGFKKRNGYSELEISNKREALENVLIPYKHEENVTLLKRNGFDLVDTFFKWYNFAGLLGVKYSAGADQKR